MISLLQAVAIREEPIVIPMLLGEDNYQIDEERRLFYVAMTRAKDTVYIVSQNGHHSDFFKEMFPPTDAYSIKTGMVCPLCGGMMIQKINQKGHRFYGCSNYHVFSTPSG